MVPVVVLNLQRVSPLNYNAADTGEWLANCSACCVPEISNAFKRADTPFNVVSGVLYEERVSARHDGIRTQMVEALREAGVCNYSIFRHGLTLFGYFETDDLGQTRRYLVNSEVNQRWGESIEPVMKLKIDPNTKFSYLLPVQWHTD